MAKELKWLPTFKASSASPSDSGVNSDNDSGSRPNSGAGTARFKLSQESLEIESVSRTLQNLTALRDELGQTASSAVGANCSPTFLPPPPPQFCDGDRDARLIE